MRAAFLAFMGLYVSAAAGLGVLVVYKCARL